MDKETEDKILFHSKSKPKLSKSNQVTRFAQEESGGCKKRITILSHRDIDEGEEYPKTDVQYFGNRNTRFKCVKGDGYVIMRKVIRDEKGKIIPNKSHGLILSYIDKDSGKDLVIPANHYCVFINVGTENLVLEDDSLNNFPERFDRKNPSKWQNDLDLLSIRNIGLMYTFVKGKEGQPTLALNTIYGKIAENGSLFPTN